MRLRALACVLFAVAMLPATAQAWAPAQTVARSSDDQAPIVAANAAGRVAVAWLGRRTMEIRVSDGDRPFRRTQRVPGVGANITPNEAQLAVSPPGQVVIAWHNLLENDNESEGCCSFWRLAVRHHGRFLPSQLLSARTNQSDDLRFAFDRRGRTWVAWDEDSSEFFVARISPTGRIVDRSSVASPNPDSVVDLVGLVVPPGGPRLLLQVPQGDLQLSDALVTVRASRTPEPPRTLLRSRTMHAQVALGLGRFGPRLAVWDNNNNAVLSAVRHGKRFGREAVVTRRSSSLMGYSLATNASGAGFLGIVAVPPGRASVRVSFASRTSGLAKALRVQSARADSAYPAALLDDAGRADLAWRTTDGHIALHSYQARTATGRVLIGSRGASGRCFDLTCTAAGATVGRRGAIFAWRDGRRIRVIRRAR